jgi:hypothetical protein
MKHFPAASYDAWKTTNPEDEFLGTPPEKLIQCDNCLRMGTEEEVWSSWHRSYGDCTQCYECRGLTREDLGLDE